MHDSLTVVLCIVTESDVRDSIGCWARLITLGESRSKGVVYTHFEEDHQSIARSSGASYPAPANTSANTVHVDPTRIRTNDY